MPESIDPSDLLVEVAEILRDIGIPYAITGGMALFVWGRPRFTADIDIIVQLQEQNADRLAVALYRLHKAGYINKEAMQRALTAGGEFNFVDARSGIKVDFWVLRKNPYDIAQIKRGIWKKIKGRPVRFVSPEDLILSKLRWHKDSESFKQKEDVESILAIQKKLDWRYLRKWARAQNTIGMFQKLWKNIDK